MSILISAYVIYSIESATTNFDTLIRLHRIADMRENMLQGIKIVQDDLNLKQTRRARNFDKLMLHVSDMSGNIDACFDCHHSREVVTKLNSLQQNVEVYKAALSRVYTMRANRNRLMQEEDNAFLIGASLIQEVEEMLLYTNRRLDLKTKKILGSISRSKNLLLLFTVFAPMVVIALVFWFYVNFTKPISRLLTATSRLKEGDLDYRVEKLNDEFGVLAQSFNDMTHSLKEVMQTMVRAEEMVLMGEMASRLAHEIKNPITGIKLAAELIRDEAGLTGEYRELSLKTIDQIKNIEKLMKGLLSFARPPQPELESENLNMIIETSLSTIEMLIRKKTDAERSGGMITVVRDLEDGIPGIWTDATQVQQILLNLMLNAIDAMPHGGILTVRSFMDADAKMITVEVSDTGEGINPDLQERIFLPFYSTKVRGTGLGLAVVSKLTELLGGKLTFTSDPGAGTIFKISFPIGMPEGDEET
jgi:signal transduction histidine kinase